MANKARFIINGTPATDPTSDDRVFAASNGQTIVCQLENDVGVSSVRYSLVDTADPNSPFASRSATIINWLVSGTPAESPALPEQSSQFTLPNSGLHTYLVRSTVVLSGGITETFERIVAITNACGARKVIPVERQEGHQRGWADVQNKEVDCEGTGGASNWDIFLENDIVTTENTSADVFQPVLTPPNNSMTGRVELTAFETGVGQEDPVFLARLAFDFTFFFGDIHGGGGFDPNHGALVTGVPAAVIGETTGTPFATGTLALTFTTQLTPPVFQVKAVHATGFTQDVKWCAVLYANECDGPIPDVDTA